MSLLTQASICITPNGYKEGKLYSVIPSDGSGDMSVVRATTATRVNSAGLVELVPYNLLAWSQDFSNAYWLTTASGVSVSINSSTAPNGTLTANSVNENLSNSSHYVGTFNAMSLSTSIHTLSVYAKKVNRDWIDLVLYDGTIGRHAWFNINTGILGTVQSGATASITNVGNGWYRCSISMPMSASNVNYLGLGVSNADGVSTYTGNGLTACFMWGAQLVEGTSALDYQKTETRLNIPRLDYSNGTCPSLLVEPQRTNLVSYSEEFSNAYWFKNAVTISANSTTAPNGILTADSIVENTANTDHYVSTAGSLTLTNAPYTSSAYFKKAGRDWVNLSLYNGTDSKAAWFNINTGTLGTVQSGLTAAITDVGNGWYRCSITRTMSTGINYCGIAPQIADNGGTYLGNGLTAIYVWGAQLEAGSYPTSYIPTTSASVTRNADYLTRSGFGNTSTSGTLFFDFYATKILSPNGQYILNLFQGSVVDPSYPVYSSPNSLSIIANGGTIDIRNNAFTQQVQTFTPTAGQRVKLAIRYNGTNVSSAINGTLSSVFTDTAVGVKNALRINNGEDGTQAFNVVAFFPSYLTDSQLELLTGTSFNTYAEMASYYNYTLQ
jgi:hypothetical protein